MSNAALICQEVVQISIDKIIPNPYQPRKIFETTQLQELARSIERYGVIQPISVRFINGTSYELVAGERRLRASRLAGLTTIPAFIVNVTDKDSAAIALIENIQRRDLNFLEEAEGFYHLIEDYRYTQEQLADILGKSQSTIANKIRLLKLSASVKKKVLEHSLTERHARALLRIPDETRQNQALDRIIRFDLNVKRTEEMIDTLLSGAPAAYHTMHTQSPRLKRVLKDVRLFTNSIEQAIQIMVDAGVETKYDLQQNDDTVEIHIQIKK